MSVNGEQWQIAHNQARVVVSEVGATLRAYESAGVPYVETFPAQEPPPLASGEVLVPWPNRVESGRWAWNGQDMQLAITEPMRNNALHGLVRYVTWRMHERTESAITLRTRVNVQPGWPVPLLTAIRYALDDDGLRVTQTVVNVGETPIPFGVGVHPYPRAGNSPTDACTLRLAATTVLDLDRERRLPVGAPATVAGSRYDFREGRHLAGVQLDTAFGGCAPAPNDNRGVVSHALTGPEAALEIWSDPVFRWVQVCTTDAYPGRGRAVAIEPMTCPPNALRTGVDLIWLQPAEEWVGNWGLRPLPVPPFTGDR